MCANTVVDNCSTATDVVDDAVGVPKSYWFVAIVNHNAEKKVAERLEKLGIANYLPTQTEYRIWKNRRKVKVDRIVIPSKIFIYCTEKQRREIVKLPFIKRFLTDSAGKSESSSIAPVAKIPSQQIELLKFMLGNAESAVNITQAYFKRGDKVKVIRGGLMGLEGEVLDLSEDNTELIVRLDLLGCARLTIDTQSLEKL